MRSSIQIIDVTYVNEIVDITKHYYIMGSKRWSQSRR